ncbi:MAG: DUF3293 domain-containing protein [Planctomycetota bacterium]
MDWEEIYRSSMYAYRQEDGRWFRFTLNGEVQALPAVVQECIARHCSLLLITAWNPMSEERPLSINQDANAELQNRFEKDRVRFDESYGCSLPEVEPGWREDGFVVYGLEREQALAYGRETQQRSLVWVEGEEAGLLFCDDGRFVPCGMSVAGTAG